MNKRTIITLLLALVAMAGQAKEKTIIWEKPAKALNCADLLEIEKVELTKQQTRLYARYYYMPGYWFSIAKESYLQSGGKTYPIVSADSITLGERFTLGNNGSQEFVLHFEPLPVKTKEFDFLEAWATATSRCLASTTRPTRCLPRLCLPSIVPTMQKKTYWRS